MIARLALIALMVCTPAAAQTVLPSSTPEIQAYPAGFVWSAPRPTIYRAADGRYMTDLNPRAATPAIMAIFDGVAAGTTGVVYADAAAANNTANGTAATTPKQGIRAAIGVCEADGGKTTGCIVYVKAGDYDRSKSLMNASGAQSGGTFALAKRTALICYGGPCVLSESQTGLSWSVNGTYADVYQTSRSAVSHVLNKIANDAYSDPADFALQASIANVHACSGDCRYNDGSIEYVKRADAAVPSDANTRVVLNSDVMRLPAAGANAFFVSGFTVYGGAFGTFQDTDATVHSRDIVVTDSYFGFPSPTGTLGNVISLDNITGLAAFFRVTGTNGGADIFNPHQTTGGGTLNWLLVDTVARNTGRGTSQSNNCITAHDGAPGTIAISIIVINGSCSDASGGAVRDIGYSHAWLLGYFVDTDRGDVAVGGSIVSNCFDVENGSAMWLQDSRAVRCLNSLVATGSATMFVRRFDDGGGLRAGTIGGF